MPSFSGLMQGGGTGAQIGSFAGPWGTAIGAGIGALAGGLFGGSKQPKQATQLLEQQGRANNLLFDQWMNYVIPTTYDWADRFRQQGIQGQEQLGQFYQPFLEQGSPVLTSRAAERSARSYEQAAGAAQGQLFRSGYGAAPSGLAAGVQAGLASRATDQFSQAQAENERLRLTAAQQYFPQQQAYAQMFNPQAWQGFWPGQQGSPGGIPNQTSGWGGALTQFANILRGSLAGSSNNNSFSDGGIHGFGEDFTH